MSKPDAFDQINEIMAEQGLPPIQVGVLWEHAVEQILACMLKMRAAKEVEEFDPYWPRKYYRREP